ncbi:MAG: ATP synthase F1 subunit gamma [Bacteroidales bacterium]|nr:ATP synthase F1 subunit gamma [Bacteroidales bacterium]
MASLREIKDRIGSVRSTLKITSAMKLVSSAKLRKAQRAIEALRPYERTLAEIYAAVGSARPAAAPSPLSSDASLTLDPVRVNGSEGALPLPADRHSPTPIGESPTAVVAIASNSSLCGGFNANVVRKALETIRGCEGPVEVYPLGRKMAEALRRAGYTADQDYNDLVAHPSYDQSAALARRLAERFERGEVSRVVLVYTSFVSASRQEPVAETYLPFSASFADPNSSFAGLTGESPAVEDYLLEPDAAALSAQLLPQVMLLKFHAAILDSAAAEQAARTLAMQTATDNAEDLLGELTLEYNKGRQQKITAEILDLLGGSAQ